MWKNLSLITFSVKKINVDALPYVWLNSQYKDKKLPP